jgi:hypothetical protein
MSINFYLITPDDEFVREDLSVNMANANAFRMLETLGYRNPDYCGELTPVDLLGRVLTALGLEPLDEGRPWTEERSEGGATMIDCGRRPGYIQDRLRDLQDLAEAGCGYPEGTMVVWA